MKITFCSPLPRICRMILAAGIVSLILSPSSAFCVDITWGTATSGDWAVDANWTGGVAPADDTTTDRGFFDDNGTYTVSLNANRSVDRLVVTGSANPEFAFGIYTLSAPGLAWIQGGNASLTSGTISTNWYQGYWFSSSTFTLDGNTAKVTTVAGLMGYSDSTQNSNSNTLIVRNGADFESTSGTFNIATVTSGASANVTSNGNSVEVTGAGSTLSALGGGGINMGYINAGTNSGREASNNSLVVNNGGVVSAPLLYVGRLAGTGTVTGNTVTIGGTGTGSALNMQTSLNTYSLNIGFGGATNSVVTVNAGGEINTNGMHVRVYGFTGNTLRIFGGSLNGAGSTVLIQGNGGKLFLGAGGSLTASTMNVESGGRFGDKSDAANAGFTSGTLSLTTMNYNPTVLFSVGDNAGSTPAIYNMAGNGVHSFGGNITIEQSEGRLTGNGTIKGIGDVNATTTLTINGIVAPGNSVGTINVTGDVVSGANAVFNFELASAFSFDQLIASGNMAFDGTLNVSLLDDYDPGNGASFALFGFQTTSGAFTALNLPSLGSGLSWDTSDLYTTGTLMVIPEPSTLGLLMVCVLGLLRRRRN